MIDKTQRAAIRQRWSRARADKRAFWRQSEIAAYLSDMEWVLDELDQHDVVAAKAARKNGATSINLETLDATANV